MDWSPVGPPTALQGDPATIAATADRFVELADSFRDAAGTLAGLDVEGVWAGLAAQQFAAARATVPRSLRMLAERVADGVPELRRWASTVEDTQARGLVARDEARAADEDLALAVAGIQAMRAHASSAASAAAAFNQANPDAPARSPEPWSGPNWYARHDAAGVRRVRAQQDFDDAVADHARGRGAAVSALETADLVLDDPWWAMGPFAGVLRRLVSGPSSFEFVRTADGLVLNTRESWQFEAYRLAGIDPGAWDPTLGLAPLDDIVVKAWAFYGDLFELDPDRFLWSGMANLAGGTFYAAFQDIHVLRRALESGAVALDDLGDLLERSNPGLPGWLVDELVDVAAEQGVDGFAQELRFVEERFLDMQKQIFDDLGWQHVAYHHGGMAAMDGLFAAGEIDRVHVDAWADIDSGDYHRVLQGNRDLLFHEQSTIIGDDYDAVRDHSAATWAMTMGMSVIAHSPVPGGRPFREVVPYEAGVYVDTPDEVVVDRIPGIGVPLPGGGVRIDTPDRVGVGVELPIENVSIFDNRWRWIETDMLPAWIDHVEGGTAAGLVEVPIAEQASGQRIIPDSLLPYEP